jgi:hypothetical protein
MLDSHRNLAVGAEYPLDLNEGITLRQLLRATLGARRPESAWKATARAERAGVTRNELQGLIEQLPSELLPFSDMYAHAAVTEAMGRRLLEKTGKRSWGLKIMLDIVRAPAYQRFFSKARFILVVRDGRDVLVSQRGFKWGIHDAREAAEAWIDINKRGRETGAHVVRYEDLVQQTEDAMRDLLVKLGEPWDRAVLEHTTKPHLFHSIITVPHPSRAASTEPVHDKQIGRWEQELSENDVAIFEEVAGEAMEDLGYEKSA